MKRFDGKVAFVAASTKGLGRALALELGGGGAQVFVTGRDEAALDEVSEKVKASGGTAHPIRVDLMEAGDIERAFEEVERICGGLDILVTNAGGPPAGNFEALTDEMWETGFRLTLMSFVHLVRHALPLIRKRGGGRILAYVSSSARQPIENLTLSNVFRPGIAALIKDLSGQLGREGILLNALAPGRIDTDRVRSLDRLRAEQVGSTPEEIRRGFEGIIPLGRYGRPEEFAKVGAFLVSDDNSYVTGQTVLVDGGMIRSL